MKKINIDDLILVKTCGCAPEQYDVFIDEKKDENLIGYIRLRHGYLSGEYISENIYTEVYSYYFDENSWKGCFDDENERKEHLSKIKEKLVEFHNNKIK